MCSYIHSFVYIFAKGSLFVCNGCNLCTMHGWNNVMRTVPFMLFVVKVVPNIYTAVCRCFCVYQNRHMRIHCVFIMFSCVFTVCFVKCLY
jgi:hypothetical protein